MNINMSNKNEATRKNMIIKSFKSSYLTEEEYINVCKKYLYARKNDYSFNELSPSEQEKYIIKHSGMGYQFHENKGLIENLIKVWRNFDDLTIMEVYSTILPSGLKDGFSCKVDIDFSTLIRGMDKILIVNPEMFLNQVPKICNTVKNVTIWTAYDYVKDLLLFDYGSNPNITIKTVNIYNDKLDEQEKFKNVVCIPHFELKHGFEKSRRYAHGPSAVAAELLINNTLTQEGTLTIIMPNNVNKNSGSEEHFRQKYGKNLTRVVDLPIRAFQGTRIKTLLYQFSKKESGSLYISDSIENLGEKYSISKVTNINSSWDFENPFKEEDEEMLMILGQNHKKLSEIADVLKGRCLTDSKFICKTDENEDFAYLDMRAIREEGINYSRAEKYKSEKDLSSEYLKDGDILIPNKGSFARMVVYRENGKRHVASANILIIRPKKEFICSEYLYTYLRSRIGQKLIKGIQREASIAFIRKTDLEDIAIIVPPLSKQKELAQKYKSKTDEYKKQLDEIKKAIEKTEREFSSYICGEKEDF